MLPSQYPYVYRDNVTKNFFGTEVADPYRWLEDTDSNATLACEDRLSNLAASTAAFPACIVHACRLQIACLASALALICAGLAALAMRRY